MTNAFGATSTTDDVLSNFDLEGRRYLVTGATSGIGLETSRALVARGATVIGTARDRSRASAAADAVHAAGSGAGSFEIADLDLASLASVRALTNDLLGRGEHFDAIIANAGVMAPPFGHTADGFELQFGTNHLGHFALLQGIGSLLNDGGRLVVLSSQAHRVSDVDLEDPNFARQPYDPFLAYGRSKTANALFAVGFDQRHRSRGVRAASVMPGNSLTDLPRHFPQEALQQLFETVGKARADAGLPPAELKSVPQAAATSVWAAVFADGDEIGGRYLEDCRVATVEDTPSPFLDGVRSYALDPENVERLWAVSERAVASA
jgi:NAD(P)-dependent dehydrogenase (short-subunit alcohol dehydrogenase family)